MTTPQAGRPRQSTYDQDANSFQIGPASASQILQQGNAGDPPRSFLVYNLGTTRVWIGTTGANLAGRGLPCDPGGSITITDDLPWWAIADSSLAGANVGGFPVLPASATQAIVVSSATSVAGVTFPPVQLAQIDKAASAGGDLGPVDVRFFPSFILQIQGATGGAASEVQATIAFFDITGTIQIGQRSCAVKTGGDPLTVSGPILGPIMMVTVFGVPNAGRVTLLGSYKDLTGFDIHQGPGGILGTSPIVAVNGGAVLAVPLATVPGTATVYYRLGTANPADFDCEITYPSTPLAASIISPLPSAPNGSFDIVIPPTGAQLNFRNTTGGALNIGVNVVATA